jgi:hypothetical protein
MTAVEKLAAKRQAADAELREQVGAITFASVNHYSLLLLRPFIYS